MEIVYLIIFFIFGIVFGSFYNVVGIRLCKNESLLFPGSHCDNCNHKLKFYENIPIISYIFLRGKCKACHKRISVMYPMVEFITGVLFSLSFYSFGFSIELIVVLLTVSLFSIVIVTDLNYYIIPDSILVIYAVLIFILNIISKGIFDACTYVFYGFLMFLFMFVLMKLGNALFKEESLGGGDIKLMAALGCNMVPLLSFASLTIGAVLALPISLYIYKANKDRIIPFGPFILVGFLIIMFSKVDINSLVSFITF